MASNTLSTREEQYAAQTTEQTCTPWFTFTRRLATTGPARPSETRGAIWPYSRTLGSSLCSASQLTRKWTVKSSWRSLDHHDIILADIIDSYRGLPRKGYLILKWINTYCLNPKYIFKAEEDILLNPFLVRRLLADLEGRNLALNNTLICFTESGAPPDRDPNHKSFTTVEEYPDGKLYPTYCFGVFYVITPDLIPRLYEASFVVNYLWIDDVYHSGVVAQGASASHYSINEYYEKNGAEKRFKENYTTTAVVHNPSSVDLYYSIWAYIMQIEKPVERGFGLGWPWNVLPIYLRDTSSSWCLNQNFFHWYGLVWFTFNKFHFSRIKILVEWVSWFEHVNRWYQIIFKVEQLENQPVSRIAPVVYQVSDSH